MLDETSLTHIFWVSVLAILWWLCMWSILDELYEIAANNHKNVMRALNLSTIALVTATFYYHPEIIGRLF